MAVSIERASPLHVSIDVKHIDAAGFLALARSFATDFRQNKLTDDNSKSKRYIDLDFCSGKSVYSPELSNRSKPLVKLIQTRLTEILAELDIPSFNFYSSTAALTAYEDGAFFRPHTDNGSTDMAHRVLTFVYYFHKEPKGFDGGELVLTRASQRDVIEPRSGQLVVFDSSLMHEVLPVRCSSKKFEDARFSITGWILKRPSFAYRLKRKLHNIRMHYTAQSYST